MRRRRKRYGRPQTPDLWANLGPGDPGYRLRPGHTGFDPFETYLECARLLGILLKSVFLGRLGPYPLASLAILLALLMWFAPSTAGVLILVLVLPTHLHNPVFMAGAYLLVGLMVWVVIRAAVRRGTKRY